MNAIVLFAGMGGATDGLVRAGLDVSHAVDGWRAACVVHRRWHPNVWTLCERVERAHEILPGPYDFAWASPSCKPWSVANRTPTRSTLHREYYSLARLVGQAFENWRARWLIVENVCGLLWSKEGKVEVQAMREACAARDLRMMPSVVNSNTVGVAQIRRRLFIVVGPEYVKIPHGTDYIPPWNTEPMACEGSKGSWERETRWPRVAMRGVVDASQPSRHANWTGATASVKGGGGGALAGSTYRAQRAVEAGEHVGCMKTRNGEFQAVGRTLAECCELQQVPASILWGWPRRVQHELVGNSVPPPLAEHVARCVLAADALLTRGVA